MLDGTRVAANARRSRSPDYPRLERQQQRYQALGEEWLRQAGRVDEKEGARYGKGKRGDELPPELGTARKRLERIRQASAALGPRARERAAQA